MKYLLDVNVLVALGFAHHEFHGHVSRWIMTKQSSEMLTCSITELGFVRVLSQIPSCGISVDEARTMLMRLKRSRIFSFVFVPDDRDISDLPSWVKSSRQTPDGHLSALARANGAKLATLDKRIPGALLIP